MSFEENKSGRVVAKKQKKTQTKSTFLKGVLRRASFHWRARTEALVAARVERGKYLCSGCQDLFGPKEVALDHIVPVVDPKVGFTTWDDYIARLFCDTEGFQILCNSCHDAKTQVEDLMREHYKSEIEGAPDLTSEKKYTKKKGKKDEQ